MKLLNNCLLCITFLMLINCAREMPVAKDGQLSLKLIIADQSEQIEVVDSLGYAPVTDALVSLTSQKYSTDEKDVVTFKENTNDEGIAVFNNVDAGSYIVYVEGQIEKDFETVVIAGAGQTEVFEEYVIDTIKTFTSIASKLVINEIYYTGPVNKANYIYDQFVELYNASDDTLYLDGLILCKSRPHYHPDLETNDFAQAQYVYQFPGEYGGKEYPISPKAFCAVATDAINHDDYIEGAADLSNADWEFYNPYKGDYDAPAANVINALPDVGVDFYLNMAHNSVILATGENHYVGEEGKYIHVPLDDILDAVEYSASLDKSKELSSRIDAGFAGIGIAKYDGQSTERRIPGSDTNNSTVDFVTINKPTPGYQHE